MKNSVILLSSVLFLSMASCKTKKSQTTSSNSSTTTASTNVNTNSGTFNTSEATTISGTSNSNSSTQTESGTTTGTNPKTSTQTENGTATGTNPRTSTQTESGNITGTNPKKSNEEQAVTGPSKNTNMSNPKTANPIETQPVAQPTVYQGVTDQSCAVEVSFGSYGSGIDGAAFDKVNALIDSKKVAFTSKNIGREGERRLCMPLSELKAIEKKDFIEQLKKIAAAGQLVSVSIR